MQVSDINVLGPVFLHLVKINQEVNQGNLACDWPINHLFNLNQLQTRKPINWWSSAKSDVTYPTATVVYISAKRPLNEMFLINVFNIQTVNSLYI